MALLHSALARAWPLEGFLDPESEYFQIKCTASFGTSSLCPDLLRCTLLLGAA